jgi:hypothetical protein
MYNFMNPPPPLLTIKSCLLVDLLIYCWPLYGVFFNTALG